VGLLQSIGKRFEPFFSSVAETLREEKSLGFRIFSHLIRISIVFVAIAVVYLLSHLLQVVIGTDIEIEKEVVIIEEVRQSELDGERHSKYATVENKTGMPRRRSARTKK
jgi:serine acetyltransferase